MHTLLAKHRKIVKDPASGTLHILAHNSDKALCDEKHIWIDATEKDMITTTYNCTKCWLRYLNGFPK